MKSEATKQGKTRYFTRLFLQRNQSAQVAQRAAAVIEAAIILPLLCIIIFGLGEIGGAINQYLRISRLSYEIARISAGTDSGEFSRLSSSAAVNAFFIPQTEFETKVHGLVALAQGLSNTRVSITKNTDTRNCEQSSSNESPLGCQSFVAVVVSQTYSGVLNAGRVFSLVIPNIAVTANAPYLFRGR